MKKLLPLLYLLLISCNTETKIDYPITEKKVVVDSYFETNIEDPYRWLENDLSSETMEWVDSQNDVTFDHLNSIPYKNKFGSNDGDEFIAIISPE